MSFRAVLPRVLLGLAAMLLTACEQEKPKLNPDGKTVTELPAFHFSDLKGVQRQSSEWRGKVLVVNYWATWCPPCRKEMPLFIEAQQTFAKQGLQVIGIAIDEPGLVQDFVDSYKVNFPILIGNTDAIKLSHRMGNRFDALPFTAIFDRDGKTHHIQAGEMSREALNKALHPLL